MSPARSSRRCPCVTRDLLELTEVPNSRICLRLPEAHHTHAVTLFLGTSKPQHTSCTTSIANLLPPPSGGRQQIAEIPQRALCLAQRQQFVVPIDVQVIFIVGLESRQNEPAFVRLETVSQHNSISRIFSWFACGSKEP